MLSTTIKLTGETDLGKHLQVVNLMAGIYNSRTPTPRYTETWDPKIAIDHLRCMPNADLTSIQLTQKLCTLLALTTMLICGEIASISLDSIKASPTVLNFSLMRPRESQRSGPLRVFSLRSWTEDQNICPVKCMQAYLEATASFRGKRKNTTLLVGTTSRHKPVTSSSVGRWIKTQLKNAGINTKQFTAHSTRGAAGLKALYCGVSLQFILLKGHWAKESTFARFYQREVVNADIQNSILMNGE